MEKMYFLYWPQVPRSTNLLSHLLHLAGGVASLVALFYPQTEHGLYPAARSRHTLDAALLALRFPQLGFCIDHLRVVHVICLHHLGNGITLAAKSCRGAYIRVSCGEVQQV